MSQHFKDEISAKKAKLAELRKQREQRQKDFSAGRQSIGGLASSSPAKSRLGNREDLDDFITSLVGEGNSTHGPGTPSRDRSRPSSYASPSRANDAGSPSSNAPSTQQVKGSGAPQKLSYSSMVTLYEIKSDPPRKEIVTYSKSTQTSDLPEPPRSLNESEPDDQDDSSSRPPSRQNRDREKQLRQNLRKEIEEELRAVQQPHTAPLTADSLANPKFPARALTSEELDAVTSSNDFLDFIDRSSKVIERALEEEYDVLADYRLGDTADSDDEDGDVRGKGRKGRRLRQVHQFFDEKWSKKRMITDVGFSPKYSELVLASFTKNPSAPYEPDGLVQIWNTHMQDRPEYIFQNTSDILTAKFSPFHSSIIVGGSYSGQVLLWDTRSRSPHPVQKTPLTGSGHTHPVYSLNVVGTQNAHNIISTSTDGMLCSWSVDMLTQPQEHLELSAPAIPPPSSTSTTSTAPLPYTHITDLAPTSTAFPASDPTYLLAGTESGAIHLAHRYPRAGARAGVDTRVAYRGHTAPVMSLDFHRASGPLDLGDLLLSSSIDWSVKIWRVRTPASTSLSAAAEKTTSSANGVSTPVAAAAAAAEQPTHMFAPALEINRDDAVYDAKWSPVKPGVFALVDGLGQLEVWDLCRDTEVPAAKATPSARSLDGVAIGGTRALNRCAWEGHEGRRIGVGGLDGVLSVFEVGGELGGLESVRSDEWGVMKRLISRSEGMAS